MHKLAQANPAEKPLSVEPLRDPARSHPGFLCQATPISRLPPPSKTPESILSLPGPSDSPLAACPLPPKNSHSQGSSVLVRSTALRINSKLGILPTWTITQAPFADGPSQRSLGANGLTFSSPDSMTIILTTHSSKLRYKRYWPRLTQEMTDCGVSALVCPSALQHSKVTLQDIRSL